MRPLTRAELDRLRPDADDGYYVVRIVNRKDATRVIRTLAKLRDP